MEMKQDMILRHNWMENQKILHGNWTPSSGGGKPIAEPPGPAMSREIIKTLHKMIVEDWEDVKLNVYENQDSHWVFRFHLDSGVCFHEATRPVLSPVSRNLKFHAF
jgi:hypothetical protein